MSYRLFANQPQLIQLDGRPVKVEAGDRLHLSDTDAQRILNSPAARSFTVVSSSDPNPPTVYKGQEALPDFAEIRKPQPYQEDPHYTPMPDSAKTDPLQDVYSSYARDGEAMFKRPSNNEEELALERNIAEQQAVLKRYEAKLDEALPENYNWRSIVSYLRTLKEVNPLPVDYIEFIKNKFKGLASVVTECDRLLNPDEEQEE